MESLDRLIGVYAARGESLVVEGVHLSLNVVLRQLMPKHPGVLPFLIHISNEAKHRERFAVRAKYMTLDPKSTGWKHCLMVLSVYSVCLCVFSVLCVLCVRGTVTVIFHASNLTDLRQPVRQVL